MLTISPATRALLSRRPAASGVIKSPIRHGFIVLNGAGVLSGTFALTPAVDPTKTIIIPTGQTSAVTGIGNNGQEGIRLELTNGSTVTATRQVGSGVAITIYFEVWEFASGLTVQYGTIAVNSGSDTADSSAFTAVGPNAFAIYLGATAPATDLDATEMSCAISLKDTTHVTGYVCGTKRTNYTIGYLVVDPDSTVVVSVQQIIHTENGTSPLQEFTHAITPVPLASSSLFPLGATLTTAHGSQSNWWTRFLADTNADGNADQITMDRVGTDTTGAKIIPNVVVQWNPNILDGPIQRFTNALSAQTSKAFGALQGFTAIDITRSGLIWGGAKCASGNANVIWGASTIKSDGTEVDTTVIAAGSPTAVGEVAQFKLAA